jgi:hypothetical protein
MKTLKIFIIATLLISPAIAFSQSQDSKPGTKKSERTYQKKSSRTRTSTDSSDVTAILKDSSNAESGPILNDDGTVSSSANITGGGRSSTGRPDADTTGYKVKRKKKTMVTGGSVMPDTTRKKKSRE